ncbi:MAG: T9SS type A sorting domain-containing protein [Crocinitomicaceae bacterium]|nr:T9SS type A sorting domain-containing protein [Crocinitomicaceae bacterium]
MKLSLSTFLFFVLIASGSWSQNLVYTPTQHRVDQILDENFHEYTIYMTTPNPEEIQFKWELISNSIPSSWSYAMCDYGACYPAIPATGTMGTILLNEAQDGEKGFFKLMVTTGPNYGTGFVELYVYDSNDINRGDTVSFLLNYEGGVGIDITEGKESFSFYPNPAREMIELHNPSSEEKSIVIMDVTGEFVCQKKLSPESTTSLDINHLNAGVYFICHFDLNGVKKTERLIVE